MTNAVTQTWSNIIVILSVLEVLIPEFRRATREKLSVQAAVYEGEI